ncbi:MAG: HAMP domain-containing sensor histidine kinase [Elusimicrobiota bacterium]
MRIRAKYQLITATLIISVVVSIAAMVISTQRKVLREQAMQRVEAMLEGAARIAKESSDSHDRLMAVSYLMFLQKTYPELAFASVSCDGHVSRIGEERADLLYLSRNVPPPAGAAQGAGLVRFGFVRANIDGEVNRALAPLIRWTAWIAGGFLFLGLLINAWVTHLLIGPIEALARATGLLATGHMDISLPVRSDDEVGTLTRGFNSMAARLRELLESREDILHTLTHEINTPLSGLKGYLELWQDEQIPHDVRKTAEIQATMMAAVLRMENSLGNALRLFRGEGRLHTETDDQIVMLDMIFKQTITIFMPMAQANGIKILPLHESFKAYVMAPEELIRQIVNNLVSNAIKYTPRGGEVSVGLMESDDEVMFHVRNTGRGIPAEDIPHLFTKFYRSTQDREKGKRIPGTGLGLNIVHKAVTALGGRVWVESKMDKDTLFLVRLPKRRKNK